MSGPSYDLDAVRRQIPIVRTNVPVNNCSQAPQCDATRNAAEAYLTSWSESGMDWDTWIDETEAARAEFAALIGADSRDVAIATSLSQATASVATGLDWSGEKNRVAVSGAEFPSVSHVWLAQERFGAEVDWVPVRDGGVKLEDYARIVDERTLIVSACHGYYRTGFKQDVEAIAEVAHASGALLYVDAYQTLGTEPFDAPTSGADIVASGNLKFLMGIPGIAFVWLRPDLDVTLEPAVTGWFGRADPFAFDAQTLDWADGARRLDLGTPPILEAYVARAGMGWLRALGLDAIGAWTGELGRRCVEGALERGLTVLGPTDPDRRTPTTAIACEDGRAVEAALLDRGVIASARGAAIRIAPHFYNTVDDLDTALDALVEEIGRARA